MSSFRDRYRRCHALLREGDRLDRQADELSGTVDAPYPLVRLPDYAGGGVISTMGEVERATRLTPEDRAFYTQTLAELLERRLAAEAEVGATDLSDRASLLWREGNALAEELIATPVDRLEDLHAKAVIGLHYAGSFNLNDEPETALRAIRRDLGLMIRDQRRVAGLLGFGSDRPEVERLLGLERQHHELAQRYGALDDDVADEVWQPVFQEVLDLETAITETPISTLAGALVKLRLALGPVGTGSGENPSSALGSAVETLEAVAVQLGYRPPWTRPRSSSSTSSTSTPADPVGAML